MPSVTRKTQSTRSARREELRERMMLTVERLLDEGETFTHLSVERIVAEAGISRSTFYVYFEDKGDLLRTLTSHATSQMMVASRAWWETEAPQTREAVAEGIWTMVSTYRRLSTLMAAMVDASYDLAVGAEYTNMIDEGRTELAGHLLRGQQNGVVRADIDAERTATLLAWAIERSLYQLFRVADEDEARKLADVLSDVIWSSAYSRA